MGREGQLGDDDGNAAAGLSRLESSGTSVGVGDESVEGLSGLLEAGCQVRSPAKVANALLACFGDIPRVLIADAVRLRAVEGMTDAAVTLLKRVDSVFRLVRRTNLGRDVPDPIAGETRGVRVHSPPSVGQTRTPQKLQSEFPIPLPGQSELPLVRETAISKPPREKKTIQDMLLLEGLLAVKLSSNVQSLESLQELLVQRLGQNSMETRQRYAQSVIRWFFPDGLNGLLPAVWRMYEDDAIIVDLLRWSYLNQEPIMGRCVADALFPCENGLVMPATYFDKFLEEHLGEVPPDKTRERLKSNLKKIGFLERARGKPDRLLPVVSQKTTFLILLHHLFAAKAIRTVELKNLLTNPFWKYLGYKSEDALRTMLRESDAEGLVGKYVVADQLEQVTTCFTLDEFLLRKARL